MTTEPTPLPPSDWQGVESPIVRIVADIVRHEDVAIALPVIAGIEDVRERQGIMTDVAINLALNDNIAEAKLWINALGDSLGQRRAAVWVAGALASYEKMEEVRAWIEWIHFPEMQGMAQMLVARELACRGDIGGAWAWARTIEHDTWRNGARMLIADIVGPPPAKKKAATKKAVEARKADEQQFRPVAPEKRYRLVRLVQDGGFRCASVVFGLAGWDLTEDDEPGDAP